MRDVDENDWLNRLQDPAQETTAPRRTSIQIDPENLRESVQRMVQDHGFNRIAALTAVDHKAYVELIYHFVRDGLIVSIKTQVPKDQLSISSIIDLLPGATFYEREVHELFGVLFVGNPDLSTLILPEDWPKGRYPMRKNESTDKVKEQLERH